MDIINTLLGAGFAAIVIFIGSEVYANHVFNKDMKKIDRIARYTAEQRVTELIKLANLSGEEAFELRHKYLQNYDNMVQLRPKR